MEHIDRRRRFLISLLYWAAIFALGYLCFRYLFRLLAPFVVALLVAWLLRPLCRMYQERVLHGRVSIALTVATVLLFYLIIGGLALLLIINGVSDLNQYAARLPALYTDTIEPGLRELYLNAEELVSRVDPSLDSVVGKVLPELISSLGGTVTSFSMGIVTRLTSLATKIPSVLLTGLICVISTIFMATSFPSIRRFLRENLPARVTEIAGYVGKSFKNVIMQYGISYLLIMLITFAEIAIGLLLIGMDHPILIAAIIAVFDIFPVVGAGLILLPWAIITLIQGHMAQGIGLCILYVVVIGLRQVIEPRIIGKQVGLPPLVTLVCMFVGTSLFGAMGLFGLPILAAILVNMNNDANVPIQIFRIPQEEEAPQRGKVSYHFGKKKK